MGEISIYQYHAQLSYVVIAELSGMVISALLSLTVLWIAGFVCWIDGGEFFLTDDHARTGVR